MKEREDKRKMRDFMALVKSHHHRYGYVKTTMNRLKLNDVNISTQATGGRTLLHLAIKLKDAKLVKIFIEGGINPDLANESKVAPIHYAIINNSYNLLKLLVVGGADINITCELEQTPLHLAVKQGEIKMVKFLVNNGADFNMVDENNQSSLDYAIDEKNKEIIKFFLSKRIDDEHFSAMKKIIGE